MIRQPIVVVMGHVDHGKTSLLDRIRETTVQKREAGAITQHIGASEVPSKVIERECAEMLRSLKIKLTLPGLLFIDTPGHEAFTNLRRRGGSMADIAVLVVDVSQGFQPQTLEAIEILREYKTPFVVAANKIDLISGWVKTESSSFFGALKEQPAHAEQKLDEKIYELIGRLGALGFESERFDRVSDLTKQVVIVPVSAKTGEGVTELLVFITGLSQRYLGKRLEAHVRQSGRGSILEVKEERGLGTTVDVILYDGKMEKGDMVVFGTMEGASSTKVRALLKPKPLDEIRDPKEKFSYVDEVHAACGVKIFAPGLESAVAGSPLMVAKGDEEKLKKEIKQEISELLIQKDINGIVLKADTLGSLEALTRLLQGHGIPIKHAGVGHVAKKDVVDASMTRAENIYAGIVLAFNVKIAEDAKEEAARQGVPVIHDNVIYMLLEKYEKWKEEKKEGERKTAYETLTLPARMKVLPNCCFRASKPAIFGVEIEAGTLKSGVELLNSEGELLGTLKTIQKEKESLKKAEKGAQVAIAVEGPTFGRQVDEGDRLFVRVPKEHARLLREKYKEFLSEEELALLDEAEQLGG